MGPEHGGLLELGMASMPNVARELPSKVDVVQTFYTSPNRNDEANSIKCGPTNLQVALLDTHHLPEDGVAGIATVQNMFYDL